VRRAAALAAVLFAVGAAPAAAAELRAAEVVALAREAAAGDGPALARLRSVDRVDGRPVALGAALDASGAQLRARLRALAAGGPRGTGTGAGVPGAVARAEARDVLDDRRYRPADLPRPLRSPLEALGDVLEDLVEGLDTRLPGGRGAGWLLLAALVAGVAALAASAVARRRVLGERARQAVTRAAELGEDPRALEREAAAAELAGDHARAVRLRFRAGLLDLDAAGAIALRPGLTTGRIARELGSPAFAALAATFDAVAYGGRPAGPAESAAARDGWAEVRAEQRARRRTRTAA